MFAISWRNPTAEHRDWDLDTYVDAVEEALRAATEITGTEQANTISLCAGGITTAALLGHLAVHAATPSSTAPPSPSPSSTSPCRP